MPLILAQVFMLWELNSWPNVLRGSALGLAAPTGKWGTIVTDPHFYCISFGE